MAKRIQATKYVLKSVAKIFIILILLDIALGLPTKERPNEEDTSTTETTFPNGTVVGKYSYVDKEGNPVEVKYYADDSSYGVELNSVKIIKNHGSAFTHVAADDKAKSDANDKIEKANVEVPKKVEMKGSLFEAYEPVYSPNDAAAGNKHKEIKSDSLFTATIKTVAGLHNTKYRSSDYDIYMPHDVPYHSMQCLTNNEKIHVYNFEKELPNPPDIAEDESQYCEVS